MRVTIAGCFVRSKVSRGRRRSQILHPDRKPDYQENASDVSCAGTGGPVGGALSLLGRLAWERSASLRCALYRGRRKSHQVVMNFTGLNAQLIDVEETPAQPLERPYSSTGETSSQYGLKNAQETELARRLCTQVAPEGTRGYAT